MLRKLLSIMLAVATVFTIGGCRTASSAQPTPPAMSTTTEVTTPSETPTEVTVATEATETTESTDEAQETTETAPDEVEQDYFQSDDFILVNSSDFEPFEYSHIRLMLEREGIDGIDFFKHTKTDSIKVGKLGDVIVGQVQMDDDDVVWNVRIEKADDFVNSMGFDMDAAQNILGGKDEIVRTIGGMTFIERDYSIDLTNVDEVGALYDATGVWDTTKMHSIEIRLFLNQTKSTLFTIYSHVYWEQHGEDTFGPPIKRDPRGLMKSDADYALAALN